MASGNQLGGAVGKAPPSIAMRAVLAVALMIGFYILAITIAAALLGLCYLMVAYGSRIPIKLLLLCFAGAIMILWSIVPRFDRFKPPGPRLTAAEQPALFREIESVAAATGQAMPAEVYLEGDVNAWVAQRGGIMGVGSRRVMGIGLGLMRVLSVDEFRGVLAHEFGHYHGGDTKLGPWVYKTRSAIGRTIVSLGGGALQKPFVWYGNMFLRITHAVSRRQEYTADRLAASVVGAKAMISGLRKVHGSGLAFDPFWRSEVVPVLAAGFRPPIADGFAKFLQSPSIASTIDTHVEKQMTEEKEDPYNTHPPLRHRVAALESAAGECAAPAGAGANDAPAISLLTSIPELERRLLATFVRPDAMNKLVETRWEDAGTAVYVPIWRQSVAEEATFLNGVTPESLPGHSLAESTQIRGQSQVTQQTQQRVIAIGAALTLAAIDAGATLECELGAPVTVVRGETRVEPFNVMVGLAKRTLDATAWREQCDAIGITGVDLAKTAAAPVKA